MVDPETYTEDCLVIRSRKLGADVIISPAACNDEYCMNVSIIADSHQISRVRRDHDGSICLISNWVEETT